MEYWLDGYNLIFRAGWNDLGLEAARRRLLGHVASLPHPVRIYFDAARGAPPGLPSETQGRARAVFVARGTADDAMVADLRSAPKNAITLVTDDRELRGRAKQLGAVTVGIEKFLQRLQIVIAPPESPAPIKSAPSNAKARSEKPEGVRKSEVDDWMKYFGFDQEEPPTRP